MSTGHGAHREVEHDAAEQQQRSQSTESEQGTDELPERGHRGTTPSNEPS
jgi:hypothetical protein